VSLIRIRQFVAGRLRWLWIVLAIAVLAVYLRTLAPGILGGDPGELQFVPYILSMPHPTGTPLYCLLGKAWSALPLGPTVAWRMNLLAAVSATLAAVVVYHAVYEWAVAEARLEHGAARVAAPVVALAAALCLAFGTTFWEQALLGDKYAFNALLVALVLYLALRWGRTRSPLVLHLLALTYGLSLAHHRTMVLFAPSLLTYVWFYERGDLWRRRGRLLRLAALCLAPLLLYLYLPWAESRGLPPGTWHPRTARQWYDYLFDTGRTGLVYVDPADLGEMLLFYARTLQRDFTWVGVALGVGGGVWTFRRRPPEAAFLALNYVLQAFLAANHHVPRHWVYFIPSFVIFALWIGAGLSGLWAGVLGLVERHARRGLAYGVSAVLAVATLAWPLVSLPGRYRPLRDAHLGWGVLDPWRQTLKGGYMGDRVGRAIGGVEGDAVIVCDWEQATALWVVQQVEGVNPGVQIVYPMERLDEAAASGRPLYVARTLGGLAERWHPSCSDSLIALHDTPLDQMPSTASILDIPFAREGEDAPLLELAGFAYSPYGHASPEVYHPAEVVALTLYWRALQSPAHDYSVSVRLFGPGGEPVFQVDSQHPVLGTYPTSRWTAGEVVGDYYEIQLPPRTPLGAYRWGVVLYRALPEGGWESLRLADGGELASGGTFEVRGR
jgi:hypothetical protein